MDGVEASRIVRVTLEEISKQYGIDFETLRVAHWPILEALHALTLEKQRIGYRQGKADIELHQNGVLKGVQDSLDALRGEVVSKRQLAENEILERGRKASEMRHWHISLLGLGRIAQGADAMDKAGIRGIIESTIRLGGKFPNEDEQLQIEDVQSELEFCTSIIDVVKLLEINRSLICSAFGVDDAAFDECAADIKSLEMGANKQSSDLSTDESQASLERGMRNYTRAVKNGGQPESKNSH
jgi:hypothetical protein